MRRSRLGVGSSRRSTIFGSEGKLLFKGIKGAFGLLKRKIFVDSLMKGLWIFIISKSGSSFRQNYCYSSFYFYYIYLNISFEE